MKPPKTIRCEDSEIPNPDYKIWEEGARFVVEWIEDNISMETSDGGMFIQGYFAGAKWKAFLQEMGIEDNSS